MKKIILHIQTDITKIPNKMHFEIQKRTRAQVFKNRKKYDRRRIKEADRREKW